MEPQELHKRVQDGFNAQDLEGLVELYESDAILRAEDGGTARGTEAIRAVYESLLAFGGRLELETRYSVQHDDIAMLSNQYTFTMDGYEATWITSEVARRQPDGRWLYAIDNPYSAAVESQA